MILSLLGVNDVVEISQNIFSLLLFLRIVHRLDHLNLLLELLLSLGLWLSSYGHFFLGLLG